MGKDSPHTGFSQAANGLIGMVRAVHDVGPIEQRGDAAIQRLERPQQVRRIDILGPIGRRKSGPDALEILAQGPIGRDTAQHALPGVPVGVDQARQDDHLRRIDDVGIFNRQVRPHRRDQTIFDEDVGPLEIAQGMINGDDHTTADEGSLVSHYGLR